MHRQAVGESSQLEVFAWLVDDTSVDALCNIVGVVIANDEASKKEREEFVCHVLMIANEGKEVKR